MALLHAVVEHVSNHKTPNAMSAKSNVAIALTALAAGAALGILFAPASGKDTRKKIAKTGTDLKVRLAEMVEEGGDLLHKMKGNANDLANKAKDTANTVKDRVKDTASTAGNGGNYKS